MIRKTYGRLVVIEYNAATKMATVRCVCGAVAKYKLRALQQGQVRACQECRDFERYLESVQIDSRRLAKLSPEIVAAVLRNFARHWATCRRQKVRATSFATFITESLADPDLLNVEDLDQSFEARYLRSNPQSYRQYERPAELI